MKQLEIQKCAGCGKGMAATGVHFYRVHVEQFVLNVRAIQRQHGLEQMLGSAALAAVMGPDEDMAVKMAEARVFVCAECSLRLPAAALIPEEA